MDSKIGFNQRIQLFWSSVKIAWQLLRGASKLAQVKPPIITIFGGTYTNQDSVYYKKAYDFAKKCAQSNVSVVTGGGPGIMYAANCGVKEHQVDQEYITTLGIAVKGVDDKFENLCSPLLWVDHFFVRKVFLIRYAMAMVVFPGGLGTCDELFEVLNYMKHKQVFHIPLVLIGVEFWQSFIDWLKNYPLKQGYMQAEYMDFFIVTDDVEYAFAYIQNRWKQYKDDFKITI